MKKFLKIAVFAAAVLGVALLWSRRGQTLKEYATAQPKRGEITQKVTATGIINPISTINIGTQVSGTIAEIYVDYNSPVKPGQLLAQIDPALFKATVDQRQAALDITKAELKVVENDIVYYKKHLDRIRKLNKSQYSTEKELETAQRDYDNALAQASLKKAQISQAEAALQSAQIDFQYTKIISPVEGIVVSKEVEVGQTVAASFQTPTLFNVAEDLTKMQIETSVVEADIAKVKEGQTAEFSVDSFPDELFYGKVTQVRNNPITTSNVVTYEVIIEIDNSDYKLKPGMTANVAIITARKEDALLVPNQALRFYVTDETGETKRYPDRGIWLLKDGKPQRVSIRVGLSDDENSEIISEKVTEQDKVIVNEKSSRASNPSMRMRMPR